MLTEKILQQPVGPSWTTGPGTELLTLRWINSEASGIKWGESCGYLYKRGVHPFVVEEGERWEKANWEWHYLKEGGDLPEHALPEA